MGNGGEGLRVKRFKGSKWFLWSLFLFSLFLPNVSILKEVQAAEIAYTEPFSPWITVKNIVWTNLTTTNNTGNAFVGLGRWDTATIEVTGTFGVGGNCRIEASNDIGTPTWYTATNITAAGVYVINAGYYQIRPNITAGDGTTSLTVTLVSTLSTPDTKNLDDLLDVVISNPLNLHIPQYNSTTQKFQNALCGCPGGGGAGGSDTQVQFNNSGAFGGDAGFTYNKTTTAPAITLTDTTALAKSLKIDVDTDIAQIREKAGASGSLLSLDLANNRVGIAVLIPLSHLEVFGNISVGRHDTALGSRFVGQSRSDGVWGENGTSGIEIESGSPGSYSQRIHFWTHEWNVSSGRRLTITEKGNIGIGTITPAATALLDITSVSKGLLIPRMTTAQRDAIVSPATGLFLYNTSNSRFNVFNTTWDIIPVVDATSGALDISHTTPAITLTDTTASEVDLQIDLDANIARIRAVGGGSNSLISLNLQYNSMGIGTVAGTSGELLSLNKVASDPTVDIVPIGINAGVQYTGGTTLGFMYSTLQVINKTGAGNVNNLLGINCYSSNNSGAGTIINCALFNSDFSIVAGTTCSVLLNYHVTNSSGTGTITNNIGYACPTLTKGTNRVGFLYGYTDVAAPSLPILPTGLWAIYADIDNSYFGANVGIGTVAWGTNANKVLGITNGTAPTTSPADMFQLWAADQVAGNSCPNIRTENGAIIKLYREAAVTAPIAGATIDAEARTAINDIITKLENIGFLVPN